MKRAIAMILAAATVAVAAGTVRADWFLGEQYKMHYPQMPDPLGLDVMMTVGANGGVVLADDFMCTQAGPISDIHFWFSWRHDVVGALTGIRATIYSDVPKGPNNLFSHPGEPLWQRVFEPAEFRIIPYGEGEQGWYDPVIQELVPFDHMMYYQVNIERIRDPFWQRMGEVYWLELQVAAQGLAGEPVAAGWKTSYDAWNDDAVYAWLGPTGQTPWQELIDPRTGQSLNLAFVITPEPATIALMGLGLTGLLLRRRSR